MPELQLSFHGTFVLKKEDLLKILQIATEEKGLVGSRQELIERTGLGNEKVLRIKGWAIRSGLVSGDRLSPEGELVWNYDQSLRSPITDWLMHFYLSLGTQGHKTYKGAGKTLLPPPENPATWGGWTYFVYSFLPQYPTFTLPQLVQHSARAFEQETEKRLIENFIVLLKTYALPLNRNELSPLRSCRFLTLADDQFSTGQANLPNPYLIGYFLAKLWERDFGNATSVLTNDILKQPLGLSAVFGVPTETLQSSLDHLETIGIIEQRRAVSPAQIIRRWEDPLILLEKAYGN